MLWDGVSRFKLFRNVIVLPCQSSKNQLFPPKQKEDGSLLWRLPLGTGHVPLIALSDFGVFARHIFDNPETTSAIDLEVASQMATGSDIAQAYEKITGRKAVYENITLDAFFARFGGGNHPAAKEAPEGVSKIVPAFL